MPRSPSLACDGVPIVHHPAFSAPQLPAAHRFPMPVFQAIHDHLINEDIVSVQQVLQPRQLPTLEQLCLSHDRDYVTRFLAGVLPPDIERRIGLREAIKEPVLIERTLWEVSGTMMAADLALEHGLACSTAGGTHHALRDSGAGFCILADLAITAEVLLRTRRSVRTVLVLDLDVHQGDGTAALLRDTVGAVTVSMHAAKNFPARKQVSDIDIALPDGVLDDEYDAHASSGQHEAGRLLGHSCGPPAPYRVVLHVTQILADLLRTINERFRPDICLYDAGVDVHKDDELGRLSLTTEGIYRRDHRVLSTLWGLGVPTVGVVGGGYHRSLPKLAEWHACLHRAASRVWHEL